jgi:hypothetical protein
MATTIAVINRSSLDAADLALYAAAVDAQLRDDFCPRWATVYTPVSLVAEAPADALVITVIDPESEVPAGHVVVADGERTSIELSHKVLDLAADPNGDTWMPMPDGRACACDPTDPVEGYFYLKTVDDKDGKPRAVKVGNFVFPSWFDVESKAGLHEHMGRYRPDPWTLPPGGFLTIREKNGKVSEICGAPARVEKQAERASAPGSKLVARGGSKDDAPTVKNNRLFVVEEPKNIRGRR